MCVCIFYFFYYTQLPVSVGENVPVIWMSVCSKEHFSSMHMHVCMCVFSKSQTAGDSEANSSGVISFRFSVKMPCVVVQGELS